MIRNSSKSSDDTSRIPVINKASHKEASKIEIGEVSWSLNDSESNEVTEMLK